METSPKKILNEWAKNRKNKFVKDGMFTFEKYSDENHPFYAYNLSCFLHINISHFSNNDKMELSKKDNTFSCLENRIVGWFMEIVDDLYNKNFNSYYKERLVGLKLQENIKFYGKRNDKWIEVKNKKEYYNL